MHVLAVGHFIAFEHALIWIFLYGQRLIYVCDSNEGMLLSVNVYIQHTL